jgi:ferredoxin
VTAPVGRGAARLRVDFIACDGRGLCAEALPGLITLDDWGFPIVAGQPVPPRLLADARATVRACPRLALRLEGGLGPFALARLVGPARLGDMTETTIGFESLLKARKGAVDIVDVPEYGFAVVSGSGAPGGREFTEALQALYAVSYSAHFLLKKQRGQGPGVMPLEALWWVDDPDQQDILAAVALGQAAMADTDRDRWRWQAMIMQPDPVDADLAAAALAQAREKKPAPGLERVRYVRWAEGRCAQLLHVGPYAAEGPSIVRLHQAITAAGYRPRGRHHEIYLGIRAEARRRSCAPSSATRWNPPSNSSPARLILGGVAVKRYGVNAPGRRPPVMLAGAGGLVPGSVRHQ